MEKKGNTRDTHWNFSRQVKKPIAFDISRPIDRVGCKSKSNNQPWVGIQVGREEDRVEEAEVPVEEAEAQEVKDEPRRL